MVVSVDTNERKPLMQLKTALLLITLSCNAGAAVLKVVDGSGKPIPTVMVSQVPAAPALVDTSDDGYARSGQLQQGWFETHRFTGATGSVELSAVDYPWLLVLKKPGYRSVKIDSSTLTSMSIKLERESDPIELTAQKPSNAWTSTIDFGDVNLKKEFLLQCGFCHQQGSSFLRRERTAEEWRVVIQRMVRYGARLSNEGQEKIPAVLEAHWRKVNANPALVPDATPWSTELSKATIREMPIGDSFSQMHDFLYHNNGLIYVGDNLQDRLYEIDVKTGKYTVYKIEPLPGDVHGGLLAGRLQDFPKHGTYQGIHSLAQSPKDGHIFITPSYQRRLIEFDPKTKAFSYHLMTEGFYPHTLRFDAKDRVWFTLALSNQIAMFDRMRKQFTYYDLPFRSFGERVTTYLLPTMMKLISWGVPVTRWVKVDHASTGTPLPYGIDVSPDGKAWFTRLHTDEIGNVDPDTGKITMIATPFKAPRRLRSDRDGNIWIAAFNESQIARYEPASGVFTRFDLPALPKGSDTPYSLNVDKPRHQVWVNGTNSDSVYRFDIASKTWTFFPMYRRATFTRDVEFSPEGKVYVTGASFPAWHIEDAQPTLMEITPQ
ncbi:MAG: hypothetical protein IPO13_04875 [Rhodocyclaceae bacterium]|nr:hypothetical protein [Rhodocyclaceae bacterium]